MSRIRSVHPGFFRDDRLVPCSAFARLLFIGLGVEADDKGIFEWKPITIKMSVFPGDNVDIAALLSELVEADAVRQFEVNGKPYGAIRNFRKFQKPKTPNDVHPLTEGIAEYVALPQKEETLPDDEGQFPPKGEKPPQMEDGGGRVKEEEPSSLRSAGARKRATRLADDWSLPDEWRQDAIEAGLPPERIAIEADKMRDWSISAPQGAKLNWRSTWRNWARTAVERTPTARGSPRPRSQTDILDSLIGDMTNGRPDQDRRTSPQTLLSLPHHQQR